MFLLYVQMALTSVHEFDGCCHAPAHFAICDLFTRQSFLVTGSEALEVNI